VYGFDFMFGVNPDPGVHYSYRRITGSNIVWDDDANSPNYNLWIDTDTQSAGVDPEPMNNVPSYYYGAVIGYNDARTPGLGSAIFLHVSHGSSTAGCVALPTDELLSLLRWLDPGRSPAIAIGTLSALTS
jgi:L,D-peptidoglycan transpeptidase YkuD (ErfK/YbiS/YcfS/YnhG family)